LMPVSINKPANQPSIFPMAERLNDKYRAFFRVKISLFSVPDALWKWPLAAWEWCKRHQDGGGQGCKCKKAGPGNPGSAY
jgi:hypothetical protein